MSDDGNIIKFPNTQILQGDAPNASSDTVLALRAANSMIDKTKEALQAINKIEDTAIKQNCFVALKKSSRRRFLYRS